MNYASEIKQRVTMPEICRAYGITVNRAGFAKCPWHGADEHPSMKIYGGTRGFHCFVCGAHGDVIDFVGRYYSIPFNDAVSKINDDFKLGYPIGVKLNDEQRREIKRLERKRAAERAERERKSATLYANREYTDLYLSAVERIAEALRPSTVEGITAEYAEAIKALDYARYRHDLSEMEVYEFEQKPPAIPYF